MTYRIPTAISDECQRRGLTLPEAIRRALRRYRSRGCVELSPFRVTSTRADSLPWPIDVDLPEGWTGRDVAALLAWAFDDDRRPAPELEIPDVRHVQECRRKYMRLMARVEV